ncbi:protein SPMIP7 [Genypterus blacodes]|uniref:protein SPMIP7 n=1 Tax=Genypterus blacodes TaxID=154954 RepID=UPI003F7592E6
MTAVLDPLKPSSAELHVIRRLNSSMQRNHFRCHPDARPFSKEAPLAPMRDDVPLLDPCCGQLSAGARVDLGFKGQRPFIQIPHVASALWVPPGYRRRSRTPNPLALCTDLSEDRAWNSRRISEAAVRAKLNGSARASNPTKAFSSFSKHSGAQDVTSSDHTEWPDLAEAARRYCYTSATQRSYEEVGWDTKLHPRLKATPTTLEHKADPLNWRPSCRRYNSQPQLWQSVGAEWSRKQLRARHDAKKPASLGTIGSKNMDNIDNMDEDFQPLTLKRNTVPAYTLNTHRTTIPGYTGKAVYAGADADTAEASAAASTQSSWAIGKSGSPDFGHAAPLSRMMTTSTPCNPFLTPTRRIPLT